MGLDDYIKLASIAGGFLSIAAGVFKIWTKFEADRLAKWQKVVIYSTIQEAHPQHLTFGDVRSKYIETISQSDFAIKPKQAKDSEILSGLLTLISEQAIARTPEGNYGLVVSGRSAHELLTEREAAQRAGDAILQLVMTGDGQYSSDQLRIMLEPSHNVSSVKFLQLFNSMVLQGLFEIRGGKVFLAKPSNRKV